MTFLGAGHGCGCVGGWGVGVCGFVLVEWVLCDFFFFLFLLRGWLLLCLLHELLLRFSFLFFHRHWHLHIRTQPRRRRKRPLPRTPTPTPRLHRTRASRRRTSPLQLHTVSNCRRSSKSTVLGLQHVARIRRHLGRAERMFALWARQCDSRFESLVTASRGRWRDCADGRVCC